MGVAGRSEERGDELARGGGGEKSRRGVWRREEEQGSRPTGGGAWGEAAEERARGRR